MEASKEDYRPWEILAGRVENIRARHGLDHPLAGYSLFVVQHVLDDLYELLEAFIHLGCASEDISVVGIPYSSRAEVGERIRNGLKCHVDLPPIFPFDGCVYIHFLDLFERSVEKGNRLIILEDGGYTVPLVSQLAVIRRVNPDMIAGAVEQTTRGKWIDEQMDWGGYLRVPVISIPDCQTKQEVEPPYIAWAVQYNLRHLLEAIAPDKRLEKVGIFGHGTIGKKLAEYFKLEGNATVYVNELDPDRRPDESLYGNLTYDRLAECDLVIGTTGTTSIGLQVIDRVRHSTILASTSSRQVEIDVRALSGKARRVSSIGPQQASVMGIPAGRCFDYLLGGESKSVFLLYDGYPVNFSGRSLPDHVADAVLSLLLEGVATIAEGRLKVPMIHPGKDVIEEQDKDIYDYWRRVKPNDGIYPS
jgi:S-adenosylhomocysteine hydrolase